MNKSFEGSVRRWELRCLSVSSKHQTQKQNKPSRAVEVNGLIACVQQAISPEPQRRCSPMESSTPSITAVATPQVRAISFLDHLLFSGWYLEARTVGEQFAAHRAAVVQRLKKLVSPRA